MSSIEIICRKAVNNKRDKNECKGTIKTDNNVGDELCIKATQLFMKTDNFFSTIKESLGKYFDTFEVR